MVGAVIEVRRGDRETRYVVFARRRPVDLLSKPIEVPAERRELASPAAFHAYLTAHQLVQPVLSTLYSLHAGRIDFIPYQFRPDLKFLILQELEARGEVQSVLIVCSKSLVLCSILTRLRVSIC